MDTLLFRPQRIKLDDMNWDADRDVLTIKIIIAANGGKAGMDPSDCTLTISPFADELPEMEIQQYAPVNNKDGKGRLIFLIDETSVGVRNMKEVRGNSVTWSLLDCSLRLKRTAIEGYSDTWRYARPLDNDGILEWKLVGKNGILVG